MGKLYKIIFSSRKGKVILRGDKTKCESVVGGTIERV
ncbi:MAG: hypothetical protein K0S74_1493 [Chlamydiales bacterium]|jgi:hypothetical protein|nr:hypothetical protein [Chlamydiales bacterium]